MARHASIASASDSALMIIDLQAGMKQIIPAWSNVINRTQLLAKAAGLLSVPVILTEQYPKGLGPTTDEILESITRPKPFTKTHFSVCQEKDFFPALGRLNRSTLVVAGVEAHVCVLQSCLDLIAEGYNLHLVTDAIASRQTSDRDLAIARLRQAGAVITSAETLVFEWASKSDTTEFRTLLPWIKPLPDQP